MKKYVLYFLLVLGCCYFSNYAFNHIDAWIGILLWVITIYASVDSFYKLFLNKQNKNKEK